MSTHICAVIDLEIGDWLILGNTGVARRITGIEVHAARGDGLCDGEVRVRMGDHVQIMNHDRKVMVLGGAR